MPTGKATATANGVLLAEATEWEVVEGNIYFPPSSLKKELFADTSTHTTCGWKGVASYYSVKRTYCCLYKETVLCTHG
jgi:uncharacterized protein (DUF427 family)